MMTVLDFVHKNRAVAVIDVAEEFKVSRQRAEQLLVDLVERGKIVRGVGRSYCVRGAEGVQTRQRGAPRQDAVVAWFKERGTWATRSEIPAHATTITRMLKEHALVKYGLLHIGLPGMTGDVSQLSMGARIVEYVKANGSLRAKDAGELFGLVNPTMTLTRLVDQGLLRVEVRGLYVLA
jgi:predicted ArsR family transcriptional regulator